MNRLASIIASGIVLAIILGATAFVALVSAPDRGKPPATVLTATGATTTTKTTNSTELIVHLTFPNGTRLGSGIMFANNLESKNISEKFVFSPITPGTYELNLTGVPGVFLPPTIA
ncbi:MAG: hypothetical protein ACHQ1H_10385, partial [Nitrososphaerales archaeon]